MKKYELLKLRKELLQEIERRKRVNELLETDSIKEFMKLSNVKVKALKEDDIRGILRSILKNFAITETNGIYVCIGTFFTDYNISYEETNYYSRRTSFDSKYAEYRIYRDIEDEKTKKAYFKQEDIQRGYPQLLSSEFEGKNIVLNPYNTEDNENGYSEVREKFFMTAIDKGQAKAKKLILDKYPRM